MIKPVTITFSGEHNQDGNLEKSNLKANGTLKKRGNITALEYTEPDGEMGNSKSQIKIHSRNHIELKREGIYETVFIIEEGKTHPCLYKTPFGEMTMHISAQKVIAEIDENGGKIELYYTIKSNSQIIGENSLIMNIE